MHTSSIRGQQTKQFKLATPLVIAAISSALMVLSQGAFAADEVQTETLNAVNVTADVLKIDTSTQDSPNTVNVVTKKDISDKAVRKLDDSLRYEPGFLSNYGADYDTNWLTVRGFFPSLFINGHRQYTEGYFATVVEPYGVESVELLQGPASSLWGDTQPGGVINVVTKKPTKTPHKNITVMGGSRNFLLGGFDISDKLNDAGTGRYRLVTTVSREDAELNDVHGWRAYIAPSFTFDLSPDTSLTILTSYLKDHKLPNAGFFPTIGTVWPLDGKKIDRHTNWGDPEHDKNNINQYNIGWELNSKINDNLTFKQSFNYQYQDLEFRTTAAYAYWQDPSKLQKGTLLNDGHTNSITFDNSLTAAFVKGDFDNIFQVGLDYQWFKNDWLGDGATGEMYPDLFGIFDKPIGDYWSDADLHTWNNSIKKQQIGLYTQAQTIWKESLLLKLGGRLDHVNIDDWNDQANHLDSHGNKYNVSISRGSLSDTNFSWNAGLMYLSPVGISPYINYSESFYANSVLNNYGTEFTNPPYIYAIPEPVQSKQIEVGLKVTPSWLKGYFNVAWYRIRQQNAFTAYADATGPKSNPSDKQVANGLEIQMRAELLKGLNVDLGYSYLDSETTRGDTTSRTALLPRESATAWLSYNFGSWGLPQLTIASGIRYFGQQENASKQYDLPDVVIWDGAVTYQFDKHWKAQINANNITNKYYIQSADWNTAYLGEGRIIRGTLSYDF